MNQASHMPAATRPDHALDPVCGMTVDPATRPSLEHAGRRWFFCAQGCRNSFQADPGRFAKPAAASATASGKDRS